MDWAYDVPVTSQTSCCLGGTSILLLSGGREVSCPASLFIVVIAFICRLSCKIYEWVTSRLTFTYCSQHSRNHHNIDLRNTLHWWPLLYGYSRGAESRTGLLLVYERFIRSVWATLFTIHLRDRKYESTGHSKVTSKHEAINEIYRNMSRCCSPFSLMTRRGRLLNKLSANLHEAMSNNCRLICLRDRPIYITPHQLPRGPCRLPLINSATQPRLRNQQWWTAV